MLVQLSIIPLNQALSMKQEVARVLDLIDKSGMEYQLTSMGTLIEGEAKQLWPLLRQCHEAIAEGSSRVLTRISIDDKRAAKGQLRTKIEEVEEVLGRPLKTNW